MTPEHFRQCAGDRRRGVPVSPGKLPEELIGHPDLIGQFLEARRCGFQSIGHHVTQSLLR